MRDIYYPDIVIYHKGCHDGVAAAWAVLKFLDTMSLNRAFTTLIGLSAGSKSIPDGLEGRRVMMVDFTFGDPELMAQVAAKAKSLIVLDHHETALQYKGRYDGIIDMSRSGAQLTWDYLMPQPRPLLIDYIGDRDLWKHELPDSKDVNSYLYSEDPTVELMDTFYQEWDQEKYVLLGKTLRKARDALTAILCKNFSLATFTIPLDNNAPQNGVEEKKDNPQSYRVLIGDCTWSYRSDVGSKLVTDNPDIDFAVLYTYYMNTQTHSLSFRGNGKVNLAQLAKLFGGGGHPNASGCSVKEVNFIVFDPKPEKPSST